MVIPQMTAALEQTVLSNPASFKQPHTDYSIEWRSFLNSNGSSIQMPSFQDCIDENNCTVDLGLDLIWEEEEQYVLSKSPKAVGRH